MELFYDKSHYAKYIEVRADNVQISHDVEYRQWDKNDEGAVFKSVSDVDTDALDMTSQLLLDMIDDRERDYDSSDLIGCLFKKLPTDVRSNLLQTLTEDYED